MHGVRRELVERQADAAGLALVHVEIPPASPNHVYEARMAQALASEELAGVEAVAFGDRYLEDIRRYREGCLAAVRKRATFPLWGCDSSRLACEFVRAGFEAVLVCVDPRQLDPGFAGQPYDRSLLDRLPADVDPCGENGEFHTFVHSGPVYDGAIPFEVGEVVERDGLVFCELRP